MKDSTGAAVEVKVAELAAYDTTGKTVKITLSADMKAGTLYTLSCNGKDVNFGGIGADTTKPGVKDVKSTAYNKVKVIFTEKVDTTAATFSISDNYFKTVLNITNIELSKDSTSVVLTTDNQAQTLYKISIKGAVDFAGNKMDDKDVTFTGTKAETSASQALEKAEAKTSKRIEAKFAVPVDEATALDPANYTVEEAFAAGTKDAPTVLKVEMKVDSDGFEVQDTVLLTLATDMAVKNTMYKLTVANIKTVFGTALGSTNNKTFVSIGKDDTKLGISSVKFLSKTKLEVTFNDDVDESTIIPANFAVKQMYADAKPEVQAVKITQNDLNDDAKNAIVELTLGTAITTNGLYELSVTNLKDDAGNALDTDADSKTFTVQLASKISSVKAVLKSDDANTLYVKFDQPVDRELCKNVALYFIDGGIGYPISASVVTDKSSLPAADQTFVVEEQTVALKIGDTVDGTMYKVTCKNIPNVNGDIQGDEKSATFGGRATAGSIPSVSGVVTLDEQTIKVFFDTAISSSLIAGKVVNSDKNEVMPNVFFVKRSQATSYSALTQDDTNVYVDPINTNAIVIRSKTIDKYNPSSSDNMWTLKVDADTIKSSDGANILTFAASTDAPAKPEVSGAVAINKSIVRVYFSEGVANVDESDFKVYTQGSSAVQYSSIAKCTKVDSTTYDLTLGNPFSALSKYDLRVYGDGIQDISKTISVKKDDGKDYKAVEFASSTTAVDPITDIGALMEDSNTVRVYFPEAMNEDDIKNHPENFALIGKNGSTVTAYQPSYAKKDGNTAILYYKDGDLPAGSYETGKYLLAVRDAIQNATKTTKVKSDKTLSSYGWTGSGVVVEVATNSSAPAKPAIASVSIDSSRKVMTIAFDREVDMSGKAGVPAVRFGNSDANVTVTEWVDTSTDDVFVINTSLYSILGNSTTEYPNLDAAKISSIVWKGDMKTAVITLAADYKFAAGTLGTVQLENIVSSIVSEQSKTGSDSEVSFAVSSTDVAADSRAPQVLSVTSLDNDKNGNVDTLKIVFTEAVLDSTVGIGDVVYNATPLIGITGLLSGVSGDIANDATIYVGLASEIAGTQPLASSVTIDGISDLAGNEIGTAITVNEIIDGADTAVLSTVTMVSNNTNNTALAKVGDIITLSIVSNEAIGTPTVTIAGHNATVTQGSDTSHYTAAYEMVSTDTEGAVAFNIAFSDLAGNAGTPVTAVTSGSAVTFDKTAPTLSAVTMVSNNTNNTALAKVGDIVTLSIVSNEAIGAPIVTIAGHNTTVSQGSDTSHYTAAYEMVSTDTEGAIAFNIAFSDLAGNAGTPVTAVTSGSAVTFDKTAPAAFTVDSPTSADDADNGNGKSNVTVTWTDSGSGDVDHYVVVAKTGSAPAATDVVVASVAPATQTATFQYTAGDDCYVGVFAVDSAGNATPVYLNVTTPNVTVAADTP